MKTILATFLTFACVTLFAQWQGTNPVYFTAGSVGIGTTTPGPFTKLNIVGGALVVSGSAHQADASLHISTSFGQFDRLTQINPSLLNKPALNLMASSDGVGGYNWWSWGVLNSGAWAFQPSTSFGGSTGLFIDRPGNVGIGTTTPIRALHINGELSVTRADKHAFINVSDPNGNGGGSIVLRGLDAAGSTQVPASISLVGNTTISGNVGIGVTNPGAKLEVYNSTPLATMAGSTQLLSRVSGKGDNYFMSNLWLRRDANGFEWWTTTLHDGISIDGSFLTPGVDTRTWWERHPQADIQKWGHAGQTYMTLHAGNLGIGTSSPNQKLTVNGTIYGKEVKVDLNVPGPDYVFEKDYKLASLDEIKSYIDEHKHLPEVPSAKEMEKNGVQLGEMNMLLLRKIEELTLHLIDQNKLVLQLQESSRVSVDASEKKIEELRLYVIEQQKQIQAMKNEIKNKK